MSEEKTTEETMPKNAEKKGKPISKNTMIAIGILIVFGLLVVCGLAINRLERRRTAGAMMFKRFEREFPGKMNRGFGIDGMIQKQNRLSGKVTAVNDKKFTVDASGTNFDVQITDQTRFPIDSANKVAVGDQVLVFGEKDSSGTIQATRIAVNPQN